MRLATAQLEDLRARIAALEKRPMLAEGAALAAARMARGDDGASAIRPFDLLAAPAGLLHEVFADDLRQDTAALGFTLGMARNLLKPGRQVIFYLQLIAEQQEMGVPYAIGLQQFGIDPDALVLGCMNSITELLWAMEEAIACRAVAAVIADIASHPKALDFTVSRRLSLRAAAAGTSVFLVRYGRQREASAAKLRWHVTPAPSGERAFDPRAPGPPRFAVDIEKGRLGDMTQRAEGTHFLLDWTENGFVSVEPREQPGIQPRRAPAASGTAFAALGHRLSKAG